MIRTTWIGPFLTLIGLLGIHSPLRASEEELDAWILRAGGVESEPASLSAHLSKQIARPANLMDLPQLVRDLGHRAFPQRENASTRIVTFGPAALPDLWQGFEDRDKEVARRSRLCAEAIEREWNPDLSGAVIRSLLRLKSSECSAALIQFLPFAADEETSLTIWFGMDGALAKAGKVPSAILDRLNDPVAIRRALAGFLTARRGDAEQRARVKRLLRDSDPQVRLRCAQGLLAVGDLSVLPVLIALLKEPSVELCWQAEELLRWAAGRDSPTAVIGKGTPAECDRCRKAWESWWEVGGRVEQLVRRPCNSSRPGLVLLCEGGKKDEASGRIWLTGCDGVTRWELMGLLNPTEAQLLPGGRVLIAECATPAVRLVKPGLESGVTERNLEGDIRRRYKDIRNPVACQRLPNGNTLIIPEIGKAVEVRPDGEAVPSNLPSPKGIYSRESPQRLPTGQLLYRLGQKSKEDSVGLVLLGSSSGPVLKQVMFTGGQYAVPPSARIQMLPGGNFLLVGVGGATRNHAIEVAGQTGQLVWKAPVPGASDVVRLRCGNILAGGAGRLMEIDGVGNLVGETLVTSGFQRLRICLGLVRLGFDPPAGKAIATFAELGSREVAVRRQAVAYLAEYGIGIPASVTILTPLLKDAQADIRRDAERAMERIKSSPVVKLIERLKDKDPTVRAQAAWGLNSHRSSAWIVAPALVEAYGDDDPKVRAASAGILGSMDLEAERAVPTLIKASSDTEVAVRRMAVHSLGRLGKAAKPAIPALLVCMKDRDITVKNWAATTLGYFGKEEPAIILALTQALEDPTCYGGAALGLGQVGPKAAPAVPLLIKAFKAPIKGPTFVPDAIREDILYAIRRIGPAARDAKPLILGVIRDDTTSIGLREAAYRALEAISDPPR